MKLLAIETSTDACSAALLVDGVALVRHCIAPREHARLILPMCEALLAEAGLSPSQLDCVAFGRGPGSFTGVRVACATAQGMAFALDLPVTPVSTLAVLAQGVLDNVPEADQVLAVLDARMGELYAGTYRRDAQGYAAPAGEERLLRPQDIQQLGAGPGWYGAGDGLLKVEAECLALAGQETGRLPHALHAARMGQFMYERGEWVSADQALPVYLRDQVALKPAARS